MLNNIIKKIEDTSTSTSLKLTKEEEEIINILPRINSLNALTAFMDDIIGRLNKQGLSLGEVSTSATNKNKLLAENKGKSLDILDKLSTVKAIRTEVEGYI